MNGFLTKDSNRTGKAGTPTNIGQNKNLTVFRIINLEMYRGNLSREFSSRKDRSRDLRLSNHNALSLDESMKREREGEHQR
jgi:hypothetical protein